MIRVIERVKKQTLVINTVLQQYLHWFPLEFYEYFPQQDTRAPESNLKSIVITKNYDAYYFSDICLLFILVSFQITNQKFEINTFFFQFYLKVEIMTKFLILYLFESMHRFMRSEHWNWYANKKEILTTFLINNAQNLASICKFST